MRIYRRMASNWLDRFDMNDMPFAVVDFLAKWSVATDQKPEVCAKRFWDLMINNEISDETKDVTIAKWMEEAGMS